MIRHSSRRSRLAGCLEIPWSPQWAPSRSSSWKSLEIMIGWVICCTWLGSLGVYGCKRWPVAKFLLLLPGSFFLWNHRAYQLQHGCYQRYHSEVGSPSNNPYRCSYCRLTRRFRRNKGLNSFKGQRGGSLLSSLAVPARSLKTLSSSHWWFSKKWFFAG